MPQVPIVAATPFEPTPVPPISVASEKASAPRDRLAPYSSCATGTKGYAAITLCALVDAVLLPPQVVSVAMNGPAPSAFEGGESRKPAARSTEPSMCVYFSAPQAMGGSTTPPAASVRGGWHDDAEHPRPSARSYVTGFNHDSVTGTAASPASSVSDAGSPTSMSRGLSVPLPYTYASPGVMAPSSRSDVDGTVSISIGAPVVDGRYVGAVSALPAPPSSLNRL